jgi:hypothetical protein
MPIFYVNVGDHRDQDHLKAEDRLSLKRVKVRPCLRNS